MIIQLPKYLYLVDRVDQPISRQTTELVINNPEAIKFIYSTIPYAISLLDYSRYLMHRLKSINPTYFPIRGREYLKIPGLSQASTDQILALHRTLYQKFHFEHQRVYLVKGVYHNDHQTIKTNS